MFTKALCHAESLLAVVIFFSSTPRQPIWHDTMGHPLVAAELSQCLCAASKMLEEQSELPGGWQQAGSLQHFRVSVENNSCYTGNMGLPSNPGNQYLQPANLLPWPKASSLLQGHQASRDLVNSAIYLWVEYGTSRCEQGQTGYVLGWAARRCHLDSGLQPRGQQKGRAKTQNASCWI